MLRSVRIQYLGAQTDAMCRGNNWEQIFFRDDGRGVILHALTGVCEQTGWLIWGISSCTITITRVWVADRLGLGHRINASKAIRRFRTSEEPEVAKLKEIMLKSTALPFLQTKLCI